MPATASAMLVKGRILESRGDEAGARVEWNKAADVFQKLEKFAPYEFFMLRYYAETLLKLDRLDEAEKVVAKLRHLGYQGATLSSMLKAKGMQPL